MLNRQLEKAEATAGEQRSYATAAVAVAASLQGRGRATLKSFVWVAYKDEN